MILIHFFLFCNYHLFKRNFSRLNLVTWVFPVEVGLYNQTGFPNANNRFHLSNIDARKDQCSAWLSKIAKSVLTDWLFALALLFSMTFLWTICLLIMYNIWLQLTYDIHVAHCLEEGYPDLESCLTSSLMQMEIW